MSYADCCVLSPWWRLNSFTSCDRSGWARCTGHILSPIRASNQPSGSRPRCQSPVRRRTSTLYTFSIVVAILAGSLIGSKMRLTLRHSEEREKVCITRPPLWL